MSKDLRGAGNLMYHSSEIRFLDPEPGVLAKIATTQTTFPLLHVF